MRCIYVDQNDNNRKDCDKNGDVKIWAPVLDDDASGCEIVRQNDSIFEEVVPASGIPSKPLV